MGIEVNLEGKIALVTGASSGLGNRFARVLAAIGQLPGEQRAAIVLRDVQGLSYQEVADVQQVELSTAKTRVHRARRRVVDLVGTEEDA